MQQYDSTIKNATARTFLRHLDSYRHNGVPTERLESHTDPAGAKQTTVSTTSTIAPTVADLFISDHTQVTPFTTHSHIVEEPRQTQLHTHHLYTPLPHPSVDDYANDDDYDNACEQYYIRKVSDHISQAYTQTPVLHSHTLTTHQTWHPHTPCPSPYYIYREIKFDAVDENDNSRHAFDYYDSFVECTCYDDEHDDDETYWSDVDEDDDDAYDNDDAEDDDSNKNYDGL